MTDCENGDEVVALDLEQRHVARRAERNDQLTQQRIAGRSFAITERRLLETPDPVANGVQRAIGKYPVPWVTFENELVEPNDVSLRFSREANAIGQLTAAERLAFDTMRSS